MCFASVVLQTESPNNAFCYISMGFQFWDIFLKIFFLPSFSFYSHFKKLFNMNQINFY